MEPSETKLAEAVGITIGAVIIIVLLEFLFLPFALLDGWALTFAWRWFIVPVFHLPQLGVLQLAGVALIFRKFSPRQNTEASKWSRMIITGILVPFFFLLSAAILHWLTLRYGA